MESPQYNFYHSWYKTAEVKFELIKSLHKREMALLVPNWCDQEMKKRSTRTLKAHNVQGFDFNLKALDFYKRKTIYNFYFSLAKYNNGIPQQNLNFLERDTSDWTKNHYNFMESYDFLIDVDAPEHSDMRYAFVSTKVLKELLDKYNVPYELRFSGRGFHIIIPYKYFLNEMSFNPNDLKNIYRFYISIAKKLFKEYSELIDTGIYDSRRVCKIPYSLAIYPDQNYVCLPMKSDQEFNEWTLEKMNQKNWVNKIRGRGTYLFNQKGNIYNFLNYLDIKWQKE